MQGKIYELELEAQEQLAQLLRFSHNKIRGAISSNAQRVADLYTGRDDNAAWKTFMRNVPAGGIAIQDMPDPTKVTSWTPPQTTANFFLSRLLQIVTALVPGTPTFEVKARTPGAVHTSEDQNELSEWATDHANLKGAMKRGAFLGMTSPHFGLKFIPKKDEKHPVDRAEFVAIDPSNCGWEVHNRRFTWNTYQTDWGKLPDTWKEKVLGYEGLPDWKGCQITEVYHPGFLYGGTTGEFPMSIWIEIIEDEKKHTKRKTLAVGQYIGTEDLPAVPLVIGQFLDSAPGEDIPPCEVVSWIPLMGMIVQTLDQIDKEIRTINNINLYDKQAIRQEVVRQIVETPPGERIFVGVDVDDSTRGVNFTMRPVEQNSVLNEYLAALRTYISIFDDITGVGPMDRGMPVQPEKSATEAAAITQNSSRRNKARLEVISDAWGEIARVHHAWQRELYGSKIKIPTGKGLVRNLAVPDPKTARFAFRVDPVDLEHISRKGEIESALTFLSQTTQTIANFRGSIPRVVREALRIAGKAMGITDVDLFLEQPVLEQGPVDRYIKFLQTGEKILVMAQDDHETYIAYYQAIIEQGVESGELSPRHIMAITEALQEHQLHTQRAAMQQQQQLAQGTGAAQPGQGPVADQSAAPAIAAGQVPLLGGR